MAPIHLYHKCGLKDCPICINFSFDQGSELHEIRERLSNIDTSDYPSTNEEFRAQVCQDIQTLAVALDLFLGRVELVQRQLKEVEREVTILLQAMLRAAVT